MLLRDPITRSLARPVGDDTFTRLQAFFAKRNSGALGDRAREHAAALLSDKLMTFEERIEHDSVLCAGNILSMLLLAGVILLQISEWSVEDSIAKEEREAALKQATAPKAATTAAAPVTEEKKTQ